VCTAAVLDELAQYAPVTAVLGNNDGPDVAAWGAPETAQLTLEGVRVAMIHDSGAAAGRLRRMRARFPQADLVVFGHSHIPLNDADDANDAGDAAHADDAGHADDAAHADEAAHALRIFNPGSPTDRRRQPHGTLGVLQVADGALVEARIVEVS
jgi:predicted phosphodiesterase